MIRYPRINDFNKTKTSTFAGKYVNITEKVHGSNGCFYVKGDGTVRIARRNGFMEDTERFFEIATKIKEKLLSSMLDVVRELTKNPEDEVRFYGEIYGGLYNGATSQDAMRIQISVDYSPNNEFVIFDIVHGERVLPWEDVKDLCKRYKLPIVPQIFEGMWENFDPDTVEGLTSKVPSLLHDLTKVSNPACEGVVIRHDDGSNSGWGSRCKVKQDWISERPTRIRKKTIPKDDKKALHKLALSFVNDNRLTSCLSKNGGPDILRDRNSWYKLNNELVDDALTDIQGDGVIEGEVDKDILKGLKGMAASLIKKRAETLTPDQEADADSQPRRNNLN